jgi:sulfate permease, SulP family
MTDADGHDGQAGRSSEPPAEPAYAEETSPFRRPARKPVVQRLLPVSGELPGYGKGTLRRDVLAGVTVAALALPAGMAYAELAGLSPAAGLYALLLPTVAYTLLGSSRQLIVGPEGSIAALVATAIIPLAGGDPARYASLASLLALLVASIYLVARIIKFGWVADYFSRAVLVGYIHGVAVFLIIGQLEKLFGLDIEATDPVPQLLEVAREVSDFDSTTLVVGVACLAPLLVLRWLAPKVPGPLVVVVLAIAASAFLDLEAKGVAVAGEIPPGLPGFDLPSFDARDVWALLPAALGIFFVGFSDAILTARSFAGKHGQHVRADQELFALGAANLAAGVTQSFAVGASGSRTAVNDQMGGRTQISGLVGAGSIAIVLLFLTEPMRYLPKATLGAVIVGAAIGLIEPDAWRALARTQRFEVMIAATTAIGVVAIGVIGALGIAVALSIVDVVRRSATPHDAVLGWVERLGRYADVRLHPRARVVPGVLVYRLDDGLFFANASYVRGRIHEAVQGAPTPVRWLVFDAEALTQVDATGVAALNQTIDGLRAESITFVVARLKGPMRDSFGAAGLTVRIGEDNFYPTVREAVDAFQRSP